MSLAPSFIKTKQKTRKINKKNQLKPTISFENNRPKQGPPTNPPPSSCQSLPEDSSLVDKSSISVSSSMPGFKHNQSESYFDTPPEMPSPPVPPRNRQSAAMVLSAIHISPPPMSPPSSCSSPSSSSYTRYNNFNVNNRSSPNNGQRPALAPKPTRKQVILFIYVLCFYVLHFTLVYLLFYCALPFLIA